MNDFSKAAVEAPRNAREPRSRYAAGVMKYREMGYWQPDYTPKEADVTALIASRGSPASNLRKPPQWRAHRRRRHGPSSGPTG